MPEVEQRLSTLMLEVEHTKANCSVHSAKTVHIYCTNTHPFNIHTHASAATNQHEVAQQAANDHTESDSMSVNKFLVLIQLRSNIYHTGNTVTGLSHQCETCTELSSIPV